ncbi:MAG: hypothetical protein KZQ83_02720 [gamma proteobacterium symbiont of Taylorina sp.]|nr:hypothetical protein [gamma proteobacterium symbiont of Taylorina sp.]
MDISPVFWTISGEIAVLLIGILSAVIWLINNDRKKLKAYMLSLKETIKKLKKQLLDEENEQTEERILTLLNQLIDYVHQLNEVQENEYAGNNNSEKLSVEKFIIISLYQTLITTRNALENSNEAQASWEKIKNELTPLIENYLEPILHDEASEIALNAEKNNDEALKIQLENAHKRLVNLEKFKQLYFELQAKLSNSVAEIEVLNQKIADLAEGSDNSAEILAIVEQNKTHYINMGQMIAMDKEAHHQSVSNNMDYSDNLINERKDEINRLKQQVAGQFEKIWALQNKLSNPPSGQAPDTNELNAGIEVMTRQLKDSEMCIETMDMEIQTLTSELSNLKMKLNQQDQLQKSSQDSNVNQPSLEMTDKLEKKDKMIARFAQESKELLSCITGMEDHSDEQSAKINQLESQLEKSKALEEKYSKLEMEYLSMEEKYLELIKQ